MHTARLPTIYASIATRFQHWGCPQVNKFEQVPSLGQHMSVVGVGGTVHGMRPWTEWLTDGQKWLKTLPSWNFVSLAGGKKKF